MVPLWFPHLGHWPFVPLVVFLPLQINFPHESEKLPRLYRFHFLWFDFFLLKDSFLDIVKASQWHTRWSGVSSSSPQPLQVGSFTAPILYRCLFSWQYPVITYVRFFRSFLLKLIIRLALFPVGPSKKCLECSCPLIFSQYW